MVFNQLIKSLDLSSKLLEYLGQPSEIIFLQPSFQINHYLKA